jgi:hypothetical protein
MTAVNRADMCDTKVVRQKYEILRANALGSINRAPEFTLFMRIGMSAWLRALTEQRCVQREVRQKATSVFAESDVSITEANLASILTDAILKAAGRGKHMKGNG